MNRTERMRELAQAIKDGSARPAEVQALADWVLAPAVPRPLTDAEMVATGLLAVSEALFAINANLGNEDGVGITVEPHNRLDEELARRGVLSEARDE